jgi:hypothetical protein
MSNVNCVVTCIPISVQRIGKRNPAEANAPNSRTSIASQRRCRHAYLKTIDDGVFRGIRAKWL